MTSKIILPQSTVGAFHLIKKSGEYHPGLLLDKYSPTGKEEQKKSSLDDFAKAANESGRAIPPHRAAWLNTLPDDFRFSARLVTPLALHLSRASALENAGLCMHPIHGFVYLPGSGLKGMARAFAETVWLRAPEQLDKDGKPTKKAWQQIEDVFGWAPTADRKAQIKDPNHPADARIIEDGDRKVEVKASAGAVVFHDAWPETWPKIQVDITNSHHQEYYRADLAMEADVPPPGDWESPVPVYYPSVKPGTVFTFAVALRLGGTDAELLNLARQWLIGALTHLGAGAKTVQGYGCFKVEDNASAPAREARDAARTAWNGILFQKAKKDTTEDEKRVIEKRNLSARRAEETYTLQLVTPAFLAGASQKAEDCDLRASTLRGQLRWWWRTMHAAHLAPRELRMLEDALWGSTKSSGAITVRVEADKRLAPMMFNFRDPQDRFKPEKRFKQQHRLGDTGHKETQGLFYASYGMDEKDKQRYVMPDGATWKLTITTRGCQAPSQNMSADDVMQIARNSIALLTWFGGVGAKARKGWGSLSLTPEVPPWKALRETGVDITPKSNLVRHLDWGETAQWGRDIREHCVELKTPWTDVWFALDQIGFIYQAFAKHFAHKECKEALGLPRKIHGPNDRPINNVQDPRTHQPPLWLGKEHPYRPRATKAQNFRHAAPIQIHLSRREDGCFTVRVTVFPNSVLPDPQTSTEILGKFLKHFQRNLK